jgi:hypothetical protein
MNDVGIMVVAQNISNKIKTRFSECIRLSKPKCTYDIHFLSSNNPLQIKTFNKSKLLNMGIKTLCKVDYKVIIQTDIDLIIPPDIIDKTLEIGSESGVCFYNNHRRINEIDLPKLPEEYDKLNWGRILTAFSSENANGCWNGMTPKSWLSSGGYNEYMIEWGREDDIFRSNSHLMGIQYVNCDPFCLIHVNHEPRTKDMRKYNTKMEEKAKQEGKTNWLI